MREICIGVDDLSAFGTASFDLEWTKNFRQKNGSGPFCFSFVFLPRNFDICVSDARRIRFGVWAFYVDHPDEAPYLIEAADSIWGHIIGGVNIPLIVGHQISTDLAILLNHHHLADRPHIRAARSAWRDRKLPLIPGAVPVVDTRYDGECVFNGKSRRLVDVCTECNLGVTQPELSSSMTAMQRQYYETSDWHIREKLQILNIRHSLSSAVLAQIIRSGVRPRRKLNLNQAIHEYLSPDFAYLSTDQFRATLD
jgi:hypothetical protein